VPSAASLLLRAAGQLPDVAQWMGIDEPAADDPVEHRPQAVGEQVRGAIREAGFPLLVAVADHVDRLQFALILILGAPGQTFSCSACVLTFPLALSLETNHGGTGTRIFPVPHYPALVGIALEKQWASISPSGTSCPSVPGLSASQRLAVTVTG
jgi:hypothetical protein